MSSYQSYISCFNAFLGCTVNNVQNIKSVYYIILLNVIPILKMHLCGRDGGSAEIADYLRVLRSTETP